MAHPTHLQQKIPNIKKSAHVYRGVAKEREGREGRGGYPRIPYLLYSGGTSNILTSPSGVSMTIGSTSKFPLGSGGDQPLRMMFFVSSRLALSPITAPPSRVYAAYRVWCKVRVYSEHSIGSATNEMDLI